MYGVQKSSRLISLWKIMDKFRAIELADVIRNLASYRSRCQTGMKLASPDNLAAHSLGYYTNALAHIDTAPVEPIRELVTRICMFLESDVKRLCEKINLRNAKIKIGQTLRHLRDEDSRVDFSSLDTDLRNIEEVIRSDCFNIKFIQVDPKLSDYLDNESLFGEPVHENFRSATKDIKSAGNCLAVGLPTAAVFHLMCVVEWGLRAFAIDLGLLEVSVGRKNNKAKPIEYAQWEQILNQLSEKIRVKIESITEWPQKQRAQEFYFPAKEEFEAFRDAWRIHVMHAHRSYGLEDAIAVFSHVNRFMNLLSKNGIKEVS